MLLNEFIEQTEIKFYYIFLGFFLIYVLFSFFKLVLPQLTINYVTYNLNWPALEISSHILWGMIFSMIYRPKQDENKNRKRNKKVRRKSR